MEESELQQIPEEKIPTTTCAESPIWVPGAVYENPNLKSEDE